MNDSFTMRQLRQQYCFVLCVPNWISRYRQLYQSCKHASSVLLYENLYYWNSVDCVLRPPLNTALMATTQLQPVA